MKAIALFKEIGSTNHYRFADGNWRLVYPPAKPFLFELDTLESFPKVIGDYAFETFLEEDKAEEFIKSYMPLKRSRVDSDMRRLVYAKCDGHCAYCGKEIKIEEMQVDHVDSHYRHQGQDSIDNYLPSCRDCNGLKSDYLLEEFRNVLIPKCAKASLASNSRASRICKAYKLKWNKSKIVFYFERNKK